VEAQREQAGPGRSGAPCGQARGGLCRHGTHRTDGDSTDAWEMAPCVGAGRRGSRCWSRRVRGGG
jgi:hypothetical protein